MAFVTDIKRATTISDVAKLASVHPATVSRVLNHSHGAVRISQKTQHRVFDAALALDFHPNHAAQTLARSTSNTLGVYVYQYYDEDQFLRPYQADIIGGIEMKASEYGFNILLMGQTKTEGTIDRCKSHILQHRIDGVVLLSNPCDLGNIRSLISLGSPLVAIDYYEKEFDTLCINVNNIKAVQTAVEHLISLKHRKIGFIGSLSRQEGIEESLRRKSYLETLANAGLDYGEKYVINGKNCNCDFPRVDDFCFSDGYMGVRELLKKDKNVTAIFCMNDVVAAGAMSALHKLGRKIPEEFSLIGFDNSEIAKYTYPPLTSVAHHLKQMGQMAADRLIKAIKEKKVFQKEIQYVSADLVIRKSTAECPA